MNRILLFVGTLLLLFPQRGFANLVDSDGGVPFKMTIDRSTKEHRLILPRNILRDAEYASLINLRTVMAGMAISMSLACLVFLWIRKKSRATQISVCLAILIPGGCVWVEQALADGAPPGAELISSWRRIPKDRKTVAVEFHSEGDEIELILGSERELPVGPRFKRIPSHFRATKGDRNVKIEFIEEGNVIELILGTKGRGRGRAFRRKHEVKTEELK